MTKKKKKIVVLAIVAVIVVMVAAGATIAYFTDTKTATNTFTMGNVHITLDETDIDNPTGDRVENNDYDVYPGEVVTKDPIVHNTGDSDAYIRAKVTVYDWVNELAKYFPDNQLPLDETFLLIADQLGEGWSIIDAEEVTELGGGVNVVFTLEYSDILTAGSDTTAMFNTITIPDKITNEDAFGDIVVKAEAIQTDGFDSWADAFAAYDAA